MSEYSNSPARCAALADDLPLLALGTLEGRSRAEVLGHVDTCQRCRAELEQLSQVAETVQQLAPEVQPTLGFELRVVERLHEVAVARRRSHRLAVLRVAAAVIVLAVGVGALIVRGTAGSKHSSSVSAAVTADLMSTGKVVGSVVVSPGNPPWMLMTIQGGQWEGTVTCEVTFASGRVARVGTFTLSGAYPSWAVQLPATGGAVVFARLIDASGAVLADAQLKA
jgi:predicted anti-sigma-YlaC factor YlaD